jgi:hypothetical protein
MVTSKVSTCVWRVSPGLIRALDERFGEPVDAYLNGSQTWLRDDGPSGETIEWRLHPAAGFRAPDGLSHHDLFPAVAFALASEAEPPAAADALWDGLEAYPAYGDEIEPVPLATAVTDALGISPDGAGQVDHDRIGDAWEQARGHLSIVDALFSELG